tara:strand:- start:40524 stop:40841 length:318 start_codon:yes stop_codon:yes gene_type:complete
MEVLTEISEAISESDKPVIKQIYSKNGQKMLAIGLRKGVIFPEHIAPSKAKLIVVQGQIEFIIASDRKKLECFDSYDIPQEVKHSVEGVEDAIFLLLLGKSQENN